MPDIKKIIDDVKQLGASDDQHKDGQSKKKALFAGAIIGLTVGAMVGYWRKWNMFYSAIAGGIIGSAVTYIITPKD